MDPIVADWLGLALRWVHVMVGIMWIGTSFYFIWLDSALRREENQPEGLAGASWMVHGGGFYHVTKYLVAPGQMPEELHWFKYESYFTWVTGFLLLVVVYYFGANEVLIDPRILDMTPTQAILLSLGGLGGGWVIYDLLCRSPLGERTGPLALAVFVLSVVAAFGFTHVFGGRAAYIHVGALLGTIMTANVFFVIIPNQKKSVAALVSGQEPDPAWGSKAKQRSLHNNYLTLPVVLMMISNHYPMMFEHELSWVLVIGILVFGGLVRFYANTKSAGNSGSAVTALLFYAGIVGAGVVGVGSTRPGDDLASIGPVTFDQVRVVIAHRCTTCHAGQPSDPAYKAPPKGIAFDTPDQIERQRTQIERMTVLTRAMPLGNRTGMTEDERLVLARWIADSRAAE